MQQQNFEKVIEEAEKWAKSEPKNPEPYLWISRAYTLTNRYIEGAQYLLKSIDMGLKKKLEKIDKTTLFNGGIVANQEKNYDFAIRCFEKLREVEPDSPKVYINLAAFYQSKGDAKRAKEVLEEGQRKVKDNILMSYYLARFYMEENPEKAEEIAKNNINKEMNRELKAKFFGLLGEIYSNKKNYEEAEKFFKEAYLNDTTNTKYLFNLALSNFLLKRYKESITYFEKYAQKNPEEADVYEYIGRACHLTGGYDKALENYKKALSLKEKSEIYRLIADCYSKLGKTKEALEAIKKASELEGIKK